MIVPKCSAFRRSLGIPRFGAGFATYIGSYKDHLHSGTSLEDYGEFIGGFGRSVFHKPSLTFAIPAIGVDYLIGSGSFNAKRRTDWSIKLNHVFDKILPVRIDPAQRVGQEITSYVEVARGTIENRFARSKSAQRRTQLFGLSPSG